MPQKQKAPRELIDYLAAEIKKELNKAGITVDMKALKGLALAKANDCGSCWSIGCKSGCDNGCLEACKTGQR